MESEFPTSVRVLKHWRDFIVIACSAVGPQGFLQVLCFVLCYCRLFEWGEPQSHTGPVSVSSVDAWLPLVWTAG